MSISRSETGAIVDTNPADTSDVLGRVPPHTAADAARAGKGVRQLARQGGGIAALRPLVHELQEYGSGGSAMTALFAASFPRFLAQVGGATTCATCGAPLHDSFHYCYNCGAQRE